MRGTVTVSTETGGAGLSQPSGLTSSQAEGLLRRVGPNSLPEQRSHGVAWRIGRQLRDPMILLLLAAAVLTTVQGDLADMVIITLVVALNTAVGVVQELRAERSISALREMAAPHARVVRDGVDVVIPAAHVVPGDLVRVEAGDVIPADGALVEAVRLQCDESALTGESLPVEKARDGPGDQALVFAGTTVTRGRALVEVTRTGADSALGRIAGLVSQTRSRPTPLQRRLAVLGAQLTIAAVLLSAVVLVLGLARGRDLTEMTLTAVSLSVAAVPESLPAVVTLALALGARRMARRSALVRGLPAVETLGSVSTLATDKTGTLTENAMVVQFVLTGDGEYVVTGGGYRPVGELLRRSGADVAVTHTAASPQLARLLRDVVLCNDADVRPSEDDRQDWYAVGDPTEAALVALARKAGLDVAAVRAQSPRVDEVPFDSARGWMATTHATPDGALTVYKGAPDVLLPLFRGAPPARLPVDAMRWAEMRSAEGLRVLAIGDVLLPGCRGTDGAPALEHATAAHAELVGLVAMADPPRHDVGQVVTTLKNAGIRMLVVTGDHPATAAAVAADVGVTDGAAGRVVTGDDLLRRTGVDDIADVAVFARIRPEQKLEIVRALQSRGEVVAMTGDGVNDAPALRAADIGVAMGRGGTEVARQAADLVLTDDALATVAAAVEEGRRIHDNVRRFLRYALSGGVAEVAFMLVAPFMGFAVPLLPAQILWVNMLTHGLPGVAFGAEPADPAAMRRPPRPAHQAILGDGLVWQIAVTGGFVGAATFAAAVWARATGAPWQTTAFLVLALAQLGVALATRQSGVGGRNWFLDVTVAAALLLQVAAVYLPPLNALLGTEAIALRDLPVPLLLAAAPALLLWLRARLRSRYPRARPEGPSPLPEAGHARRT